MNPDVSSFTAPHKPALAVLRSLPLPVTSDIFARQTFIERDAVAVSINPSPPAAKLPTPGWVQKFKDLLESPWAPKVSDLPVPNRPEDFGNSSLPFRQAPLSQAGQVYRQDLLRFITQAQRRDPVSNYSSLYQYSVPVRNLPTALQEFKILHLSDIHFEKENPRPLLELQKLADYLERSRTKVDLLLISGDIITKHIDDLTPAALKCLERLAVFCPRAFSVLGNHDYHGFAEARLNQDLERIGIFSLDNARLRINLDDAVLGIYGVEDAIFGKPRAPLNVQPGSVNILLTHNLDAVRANFPDSFDLILSGHTHWGEVRIVDGTKIMGVWGYADNVNRHTKGWAALSDRALSFVHPGLARYYVPFNCLRHPPGFVLHTLTKSPLT